MFPPMTPLTERVCIDFANRQLEQQAVVTAQTASPARAGRLMLLHRLFSRRAAQVAPSYSPAQPNACSTACILPAVCDAK